MSVFVGLFLPLLGARYVKVQSTDIRLAFLSDTHFNQGVNIDSRTVQCSTFVEYINNLDLKPKALIIAGDLTIAPHLNTSNPDTFLDFFNGLLDPDIELLPVLGNWEGDSVWSAANNRTEELYDSNTDPYSFARTYLSSWIGQTTGYYSREYGMVKVFILNNNVDTTYVDAIDDTLQVYANDNPPGRGLIYWQNHGYPDGRNVTNPDYSGFVTENSAQWTWFVNELDNHTKGTWRIAVAQRGIYGAHGTEDYDGLTAWSVRPNIYAARWGIVREFDTRSGDLFVTGDQHIVSYTTRLSQDAIPSDSVGAHHLSLRCGFTTRDTTLKIYKDGAYYRNTVPDGSLKYAVDHDTNTTSTYFAILTIHGDRGYLEIGHVTNTTVTIDYTTVIIDNK
jgi:hypothetical protein